MYISERDHPMTGSIVSAGDLERYCTTHELVLLYDRVSFSPLHSRGAVAISARTLRFTQL